MASAGSRKVLFIVENLPSPFDRRVWQEATTLHDNGFTVSIICPTGKGFEKKFEIIDGIAIYRHNLPTEGSGALGYLVEYSAALFWEFWLAWKALRQRGFDVIHACNPPDDIFLVGGFFKIFLRKKFLFDHHDINPELYLAKFGKKDFLYKLMVFLERMTFRTADVSIATNESYKKIAIERGKMPANKVFVVRSGPSLERMKIQAPVPKLKHGREFLVGYVGVMGKQEGLQYLLQAAQYIVETLRRNDIQFGIVGGGTELDSLRREAKDMGLEEFVTFTGRVPDKEMLDMLNTADVCVNPDVYNEMNDKSTMNKIMEYMSLGKPIVQFDLTEGRFSAGEASLYAERNDFVSLANKLVDLIDDPEKRKTMGEFGRRRIEQELEWKYEAPKLLAAYDALWPDKSA
ncbi:MAG TPA: glycosyltransferase family 4 protein [Fimbriimonadales bacterium]|nr:glycosyltransferase family 4 protein [Fimbriimonadales bacterium]